MPEAPAAIAVLSTTRMSSPDPRPLAFSICARWKAVLRPWMPAPITAYLVLCGIAMRDRPRLIPAIRPAADSASSEFVVDLRARYQGIVADRLQTNLCPIGRIERSNSRQEGGSRLDRASQQDRTRRSVLDASPAGRGVGAIFAHLGAPSRPAPTAKATSCRRSAQLAVDLPRRAQHRAPRARSAGAGRDWFRAGLEAARSSPRRTPEAPAPATSPT